jgi:hypothetical protein
MCESERCVRVRRVCEVRVRMRVRVEEVKRVKMKLKEEQPLFSELISTKQKEHS